MDFRSRNTLFSGVTGMLFRTLTETRDKVNLELRNNARLRYRNCQLFKSLCLLLD